MFRRLCLLLVSVAACAGQDSVNDPSESGESAQISSGNVTLGGYTDGEDSGGTGIDSMGGGGLGPGLEGVWSGSGVVVPGTSYDGYCELYLEEVIDNDRDPICISGATVTSVVALSTCEECEFAFEVEFTDPEIETDVDGACAQWGGGEADLLGVRVTLGYANGALMRLTDGGWIAIGDAEYEPITGELFYELPYDAGP